MNKKFLLVAAFITFIFADSSFAADIGLGEGYHVPDGFDKILITSSDGTAIQNAVDHIKDGGTVELSGKFLLKKNISINKNLTLKGVDNALLSRDKKVSATFCIIKCEGSHDITLENLTIIGGIKSRGGGINISGGRITIISCDIHDNFAWLGGGGIISLAETLTLKSCDIYHNKCGLLGGGIYICSPTVTITGCKITSNDGVFSGGGLAASSSDITMTNCVITGNRSTYEGHGVSIQRNTKLATISCNISGNLIMSSDKGLPSSADVSCDPNSTYIINEETVESK